MERTRTVMVPADGVSFGNVHVELWDAVGQRLLRERDPQGEVRGRHLRLY